MCRLCLINTASLSRSRSLSLSLPFPLSFPPLLSLSLSLHPFHLVPSVLEPEGFYDAYPVVLMHLFMTLHFLALSQEAYPHTHFLHFISLSLSLSPSYFLCSFSFSICLSLTHALSFSVLLSPSDSYCLLPSLSPSVCLTTLHSFSTAVGQTFNVDVTNSRTPQSATSAPAR